VKAVIDLKLGRGRYRREELADGRAVQLALYARALSEENPPPTGYFMVGEARMLTAADVFPGAARVPGPSAQETLATAEGTWLAWQHAVTDGVVPAPHPKNGARWEIEAQQLTGEWPPPLRKPPCDWCHFATLCTARIGDGDR
jgi:hypothetical protein